MMCSPSRLAILAFGLISFSTWAEPGQAAPSGVFGRDNATAGMTSFPSSQAKFNKFTALLNSFGVDDIESIPNFTPNPTLVFGTTGITAATQAAVAADTGNFDIGSRGLVELDAASPVPLPAMSTIFTFNQYINAFGIFVIQGGDAANNNPTTFRLSDTVTNAFVDVPVQVGPGWGTNNVFFLGLMDSVPFNQVEIIESSPAADLLDGMIYDNVVAGFVPEPGSLVLMMLGGAFVLCRRARFRHD